MTDNAPAVPPVPFDYTSRDYSGIRESLIGQLRARIPGWTGYADPSDFALALVESFAYAVDGLHYYLDRIANEAYVSTAVRPESVRHMAQLMGYRPSKASSATALLAFTNTTNAPITVPSGTRVQTSAISDVTLSPIYFEVVGTDQSVDGVVIPAGMTVSDVPAVEGLTFDGDDGTGEVLAVSSGFSWDSYTIPRSPVVHGFVRVFVSYSQGWSEEWTQVEDIRSAPAGESVFQVEAFSGQPVRIRFGNGQSGAIPPKGSIIKVIYRVGGGRIGNVTAGAISVISDDISLIGLSVTNPAPAVGGAEEESIESIRQNILWRGSSGDERAVSLVDFERIALTHMRVGKAYAYSWEGSDLNVVIGPIDDGTLRPGLQLLDGGGTAMTDSFSNTTTGVAASVQKMLTDAAFAGAQVTIIMPEYVQVHLRVQITVDSEVLQRTRDAMTERLRVAFSYPEVYFGQEITLFQIQRLFSATPGVLDVNINQFTVEEDNGSDPNWANQVGTISLQPNQIPWIDLSTGEPITFVATLSQQRSLGGAGA